MSMDALILATEACLRTQFGWSERECTAALVPNPPMFAGQMHVTISPAGVQQQDENPQSLDGLYDLVVALTFRLAEVPRDRKGRAKLLQDNNGPMRLGDRVGAFLHGSYAVLNAANALIPDFDVETNGFIEPLKLRAITYQEVDSAWVGAEADDDDAGDKNLYLVTVTVGGARRVRVLGPVA